MMSGSEWNRGDEVEQDRWLLLYETHRRVSAAITGNPKPTLMDTLESYSPELISLLHSSIGAFGGNYGQVLPTLLATAANRGKSEHYLVEAKAYFDHTRLTSLGAENKLALGVDRLQLYKQQEWFPSRVEESDWEQVGAFLDLIHEVTETITLDSINASPTNYRGDIPLVWSHQLSSNRWDFEDLMVDQYLFENPEDAGVIRALIMERKSSKWSVLKPLLHADTRSLARGVL